MHIVFVRLPATPLLDRRVAGVFGGAEVRAWTFARALAQRKTHRVGFAVRSAGAPLAASCEQVQIHAIPSRRRARDRAWSWQQWWQGPHDIARRNLHSFRSKLRRTPPVEAAFCQLEADVLAAFGLHDPTASVVESAHASGKKAIVFLTSDHDVQVALEPRRMGRRRDVRRHRFALLHADLVVAQTELQREAVARAGQQVVLIRNPIDTRLPAGRPLPLDQRPYVLWVGRADADCKRADLCWQLAVSCPEVPLVAILNRQDDRLAKRLMSRVPPNLRVVSQVAWRDSESLYREARALLNTSESEGFPNAFLQAAKHGVPILSRRVNPDQVLTRHGIGFVAGDHLETLAAMLRRVWHEPQRFCQVAAAGRRYVVEHHDLEARVDDLEAAAQALLPARSAVAAA